MKTLSMHRPLPSHGYTDPGPLERVGPGEGRERAALVGVHDFRPSEPADCLIERLLAELGFQRVRDAPGENLAGSQLSPWRDTTLKLRELADFQRRLPVEFERSSLLSLNHPQRS